MCSLLSSLQNRTIQDSFLLLINCCSINRPCKLVLFPEIRAVVFRLLLDHLPVFCKLVFLHLSLEYLDKLILYRDYNNGWDNFNLMGQSQSSTTEPKHLGQKKAVSPWHKPLTGCCSLLGCIDNNHQP